MRLLLIWIIALVAVGCGGSGESGGEPTEKKIVWYALMVHPYVEEVQKGVIGYERDTGVKNQTPDRPKLDPRQRKRQCRAAGRSGLQGLLALSGGRQRRQWTLRGIGAKRGLCRQLWSADDAADARFVLRGDRCQAGGDGSDRGVDQLYGRQG